MNVQREALFAACTDCFGFLRVHGFRRARRDNISLLASWIIRNAFVELHVSLDVRDQMIDASLLRIGEGSTRPDGLPTYYGIPYDRIVRYPLDIDDIRSNVSRIAQRLQKDLAPCLSGDFSSWRQPADGLRRPSRPGNS